MNDDAVNFPQIFRSIELTRSFAQSAIASQNKFAISDSSDVCETLQIVSRFLHTFLKLSTESDQQVLLNRVISIFDLALDIHRMIESNDHHLWRGFLSKMTKLDRYFFPITFYQDMTKHMVILEVEKLSVDNHILSVYNYGPTAAEYHPGNFSSGFVSPVYQLIVPASRIRSLNIPIILHKLFPPIQPLSLRSSSPLYEVFLPALGSAIEMNNVEKVSISELSSNFFPPVFAILSKLLQSEALFSRIKFICLSESARYLINIHRVNQTFGPELIGSELSGFAASNLAFSTAIEYSLEALERGGISVQESNHSIQFLLDARDALHDQVQTVNRKIRITDFQPWKGTLFSPNPRSVGDSKLLPSDALRNASHSEFSLKGLSPEEVLHKIIHVYPLNLTESQQEFEILLLKLIEELSLELEYWCTISPQDASQIIIYFGNFQKHLFEHLILDLSRTPPIKEHLNIVLALLKVHTLIDMINNVATQGILPTMLHPWIYQVLDLNRSFSLPIILKQARLRILWHNLRNYWETKFAASAEHDPYGINEFQTFQAATFSVTFEDFTQTEPFSRFLDILWQASTRPEAMTNVSQLNTLAKDRGNRLSEIFRSHSLMQALPTFSVSVESLLILNAISINRFPSAHQLINFLRDGFLLKVDDNSTLGVRLSSSFAGWSNEYQLFYRELSDLGYLRNFLFINSTQRLRVDPILATRITPLEFPFGHQVGSDYARRIFSISSLPDLQLNQIVGYFLHHLLELSEVPLQAFFEISLFEYDLLDSTLKSNSTVLDMLFELISSGMNAGTLFADGEFASYFAYLLRLLIYNLRVEKFNFAIPLQIPFSQSFFEFETLALGQFEKHMQINLLRLRSLIAADDLQLEEFGEYLGSLLLLKREIADQRIFNYYEEMFQSRYSFYFRSYLEHPESRDIILNSAFRLIYRKYVSQNWIPYPHYPNFATRAESVQINCQTFTYQSLLLGVVRTPPGIRESQIYRQIFGTEPLDLHRLQSNLYEYVQVTADNQSITWRILDDSPSIVIHRLFDDGWYQAFSPEEWRFQFSSVVSDRFRYIAWAQSSNPLHQFLTTAEGTPFIRIEQDFELDSSSAYLIENNATLVNLTCSHLRNLLQGFEGLEHILIFSKQQKISNIIFPRYSLHCRRNEIERKNILVCDSLNGFGIGEGEEDLNYFRSFRNYLPLVRLEKNITRRAVLISATPNKSSTFEFLSSFFYEIHAIEEQAPPSQIREVFVPVENSIQRMIISYSELASIFASERLFDQAQYYATKLSDLLKVKVESTSDETFQALMRLIKRIDAVSEPKTPESLSLQLRARSFLIEEISLQRVEKLSADFDTCAHTNFLELYKSHSIPLSFSLDESELAPLESILAFCQRNHTSAHPSRKTHFSCQLPSCYDVSPFPGELFSSISGKPKPSFDLNYTLFSSDSWFFNQLEFLDYLLLYGYLHAPGYTNPHLEKSRLVEIARLNNEDSLFTELETAMRFRYFFALQNLSPPLFQNPGGWPSGFTKKVELCCLGSLFLRRQIDERWFDSIVHRYQAFNSVSSRVSSETRKIFFDEIWSPRFFSHLTDQNLSEECPRFNTDSVAFKEPSQISNEVMDDFKFDFEPSSLSASCQVLLQLLTEQTVPPFILDSWLETGASSSISSSPFKISSPFMSLQRTFSLHHESYVQFLRNDLAKIKTFKLDQVSQVQSLLSNQLQRSLLLEAAIPESKRKLFHLLNKRSSDSILDRQHTIRVILGTRRDLDIGDAQTAMIGGWNASYLITMNPNLNLADVGSIFQELLQYMLSIRDLQRLRRSIASSENLLALINSSSTEQNLRIDNWLLASKEKILYHPQNDPLLLLLETELNLYIWPEQLSAISMLSPRKQISSLIELAMGMGKTDVISPVVLRLLADGETLPILVMPEALIQSTSFRLQEILKKAFSSSIRVIPIERGMRAEKDIEFLLSTLASMLENRVVLVWSPTDLQTLMNSFIECLESQRKNLQSVDSRQIRAWRHLLSFLRKRAHLIGDEVHSILDVLTSYNFAISVADSPDEDEINAVITLVQKLLNHPHLTQETQFPFLPPSDGIPFTESHFHTNVAPVLAEALLEFGITGERRSQEFVSSLTQEQKCQLRDYLLSTNNISLQEIEQIQVPHLDSTGSNSFKCDQRQTAAALRDPSGQLLGDLNATYRRLNIKIHNYLAVYKESLRVVFPLTAIARLGKHYTVNLDEDGAIPCDNGVPQYNSLFGTSLERMYYTIFLFLQTGIPEFAVRDELQLYVDGIRNEIRSGIIDEPRQSLWLQKFRTQFGSRFQLTTSGFSDRDVGEVMAWINNNPERQLEIIQTQLLPKIVIFRTEIESTPHILPLLVKPISGLHGMTGTLYNRDTYPSIFGSVEYSRTILMFVNNLKKSSPKKATIIPSLGDRPSQILESIFSNARIAPSSLIDTTGCIPHAFIEEFALSLLELVHSRDNSINNIAFYKGEDLVVRSWNGITTLYDRESVPESLIALWDVAHNTGSDIRLSPNAHAVMIIDRHIRLFELAQAAMRLRLLGQGQTLEILVTEADAQVMRSFLSENLHLSSQFHSTLPLDQVIQYALVNQLHHEMENNFRAIDLKMKMVLIAPILSLLLDSTLSDIEVQTIYQHSSSLFIKEQPPTPWEHYGAPIYRVNITDAKQELLRKWKEHPLVNAIEQDPRLFQNLTIEEIHTQLGNVLNLDNGPLHPFVDSISYLGSKQRQETKTKLKLRSLQSLETPWHHKPILNRDQAQIIPPKNSSFLDKSRYFSSELPRNPIPSLPFLSSSHFPTACDRIPTLTFSEINANSISLGLTEVMNLHDAIPASLRSLESAITFSSNLIPLWDYSYVPFGYFQSYADYGLIIQHKSTGNISLHLISNNEALEYISILTEVQCNDEEADVRLGVYHFQADRILSSGCGQIVVSPGFQQLLMEAKLLSGYTHYTPDQKEYLLEFLSKVDLGDFLRNWIVKFIELRKPKSFFRSDLGKSLLELGLSEESQLQTISEHGEMIKMMVDLFFDTSASASLRATRLSSARIKDTPDFGKIREEWARYLVPLLPDIFTYDQDCRVSSQTDGLARIRRDIVSLFLSSTEGRLSAIRMATWDLDGIHSFSSPELSTLELKRFFTFQLRPPANLTKIAKENNLIWMSELLHPEYGITFGSDETTILAVHQTLSKIDLQSSLKQFATDSLLHHLYGLFDFLSSNQDYRLARIEYGLRLIPHLVNQNNICRSDMGRLIKWIPSKLLQIDNLEMYLTYSNIKICLSSSLNSSRNILPDFSRMAAFDQFFIDKVAEKTAHWLMSMISEESSAEWFLDQIILKLLSKNPQLLDHDRLRTYKFSKRLMEEIVSRFSNKDRSWVVLLLSSSPTFDMIASLFAIPTLNRPALQAETLADWMLSIDITNWSSEHENLFDLLCGHLTELSTKRCPETCRKVVGFLLEKIDNLSLSQKWSTFTSLQQKLLELRLISQGTSQSLHKQGIDLLREIVTGSTKKNQLPIVLYYIKHRLISAPAEVAPKESVELLSSASHKCDDEINFLSQEFRNPIEKMLLEVISSFSFNGTPNQSRATFEWFNLALRSRDVSRLLIYDHGVLLGLEQRKIEFQALANYYNRHSDRYKLLGLLKSKKKSSYFVANNFEMLTDLAFLDFPIFAELIELEFPQPPTIDLRKFTQFDWEQAPIWKSCSTKKSCSLLIQMIAEHAAGRLNSLNQNIKNEISTKKQLREFTNSLARLIFRYAASSIKSQVTESFIILRKATEESPDNFPKTIREILDSKDWVMEFLLLEYLKSCQGSYVHPLTWQYESFKDVLKFKGEKSADTVEYFVQLFGSSEFVSIFEEMLMTARDVKPIFIRFLRHFLSTSPEQILHSNLEKYLQLLEISSKHHETYLSILNELGESKASSLGSQLHYWTGGNFGVISEMLQLRTKNRQPVEDLKICRSFLQANQSTKTLDAAFFMILERLVSNVAKGNPETDYIRILRRIETISHSAQLSALVVKLRSKVELYHQPTQNLQIAMNHLRSKSLSKEAADYYRVELVRHLLVGAVQEGTTDWISSFVQLLHTEELSRDIEQQLLRYGSSEQLKIMAVSIETSLRMSKSSPLISLFYSLLNSGYVSSSSLQSVIQSISLKSFLEYCSSYRCCDHAKSLQILSNVDVALALCGCPACSKLPLLDVMILLNRELASFKLSTKQFEDDWEIILHQLAELVPSLWSNVIRTAKQFFSLSTMDQIWEFLQSLRHRIETRLLPEERMQLSLLINSSQRIFVHKSPKVLELLKSYL